MAAAAPAPLHATLVARRSAIADRWYRAVARTGFAPLGGPEVRARLLALTDRALAALLAEPFAPDEARAIGTALADLHYLHPAALEGTLAVLGAGLATDLPPATMAGLRPRLAALLGALARGYYAAARDAILAEQEAARAPLLAEQRRIEAALRASEARLRAVVTNSPVLLFALDRDGVFTLAEGKGLAALGLTPEVIVGRAVEEHFAAVPALARDVRRALAGEDCTAIAEMDGLVLEARHTPVRDETGAVIGVIGVATDITARRRAEERLHAVITNAPVVLFAFDPAGIVTLSEGRGLAPLGLSGGEIVGRSLFDLYRDAPTVLANVCRALAGEAFDAVVEVVGVAFETRYAPLRDAAGDVAGVIGVATDVTALTATRRRLLASREAAQAELARELHDGPVQELYGVTFHLETLADTLPDAAARARLAAGLAALEGVAGTLRAISRELRPPTLAPFGLAAVIGAHARRVREARPDLTIHLDLAPDEPTLAEPDRLALFRIVQEALRNAAQHAGARTVWVRLGWDAATITVEVRDDGVGFAPPPRWAALVERGHLGLAGATERAEALGGRLTVESAPGRGTIVRAVIPRPVG